MTVWQLLNSLDSRELSEWMAYFALENKEKPKEPTVEDSIKFGMTGYKNPKGVK